MNLIFDRAGYDVILLNDVYSETQTQINSESHKANNKVKWSFWSRYLGPYTIKNSIKEANPDLSVIVVDYFTKVQNFFEYMEKFVGPNTKYIGISITFLQYGLGSSKGVTEFNLWHTHADDMISWFQKLKSIAPDAKILIGGHACDAYFKHYIQSKEDRPLPVAMRDYISYVFHGYSETIIQDFFKGTVKKEHIYEKEGVTFLSDNSKAGVDARCIKINWDAADCIKQGEWLPLEISKGCRFNCKFCMFDRQGTVIKAEDDLRSELIKNYENYGVTGYSLTDDTVNDSLDKVKMLHRVFTSLPFKIEWIAYARPDMFYAYPEMLDLMIESGCRGMFLGIETFDNTAAKIVGKGLNPQLIKDILVWIKEKAGDSIFVLSSFIIGLVGETEQSLDDTLDWLVTQKVIDKITFEILYIRDPGYRTETRDDFSRNKNKFGFKELRFNPDYYWEHDTLNYTQCKGIAEKWKSKLSTNTHTGHDMAIEGFTNFWSYPRMRSLGYSHKRSFDMLKTGIIPDDVYEKNVDWILSYHSLLR